MALKISRGFCYQIPHVRQERRRRPPGSLHVAISEEAVVGKARSCLSRAWREIQGANDWKDLVTPLNPLLRQEIVRYGEFVNTCYKAFELDSNSNRYLNCKHCKRTFLKELGMERSGYEITKYLYASPDVGVAFRTSWMGYVAVSCDEESRRLGRRDVLVAFRGTVTATEWFANLMSSLIPAKLDPHEPRLDVRVEEGFLSMYTSKDVTSEFAVDSCREQLLLELSSLISMYRGEEMSITFAGHSMGSSLAILAGYDISELGMNKGIPTTVYSFAGPRVGNENFKSRCEELGVKVLRVVNINDPVTKLPGVFLNEKMRAWCEKYELPWNFSFYVHVGVELALDFFKMKDPGCVHDLEAHIRLLRSPEVVQQFCDEEDDMIVKFVNFLST